MRGSGLVIADETLIKVALDTESSGSVRVNEALITVTVETLSSGSGIVDEGLIQVVMETSASGSKGQGWEAWGSVIQDASHDALRAAVVWIWGGGLYLHFELKK